MDKHAADLQELLSRAFATVPMQPQSFDVAAFDKLRALGLVPDRVRTDLVPTLGSGQLVKVMEMILGALEHSPEAQTKVVDGFRNLYEAK